MYKTTCADHSYKNSVEKHKPIVLYKAHMLTLPNNSFILLVVSTEYMLAFYLYV